MNSILQSITSVAILYRYHFWVKLCLFFTVVFLLSQNAVSDPKKMQDRLWLLEKYEHTEAQKIIDTVKADLLSNDVLVQDAGCLVLLKALDGLKTGDKKSEVIFKKLSEDQKLVVNITDIIDARLLGWCNPEESDVIDEDIRIYVPLFIILGKADNKMARHTISKSLLYLRGHEDILEQIALSQELVSYSLRRLSDIQSKYCCIYPGKETVAEILEKDYRYRMLLLFEKNLKSTIKPDITLREKIRSFVIDCLKYGDAKNGYVIRIKALQVAQLLLAEEDRELVELIKKMAQTDPFYLHAYIGKFGFSLTELNYPVREVCRKVLAGR
jgi:hypothetical protein